MEKCRKEGIDTYVNGAIFRMQPFDFSYFEKNEDLSKNYSRA
jgi:hypothetical protein